MKIKQLSLDLSNNEILAVLNKFCDNKKIHISFLELNKNILIKGYIPLKALSFPFSSEISLHSINNGNISFKILSFSAVNTVLPNKMKDMALKTIMSLLTVDGISISSDIIKINFKSLSNDIDLSNLEISKFSMIDNQISITLNNIENNKPIEDFISSVV